MLATWRDHACEQTLAAVASAGRVRAALPCPAETRRATLYLSVPSIGKSSTDSTTIVAVAAVLGSGGATLSQRWRQFVFDAKQSHEAMTE